MDEHTIKQKFLHIFTEIWLPPVIVAIFGRSRGGHCKRRPLYHEIMKHIQHKIKENWSVWMYMGVMNLKFLIVICVIY